MLVFEVQQLEYLLEFEYVVLEHPIRASLPGLALLQQQRRDVFEVDEQLVEFFDGEDVDEVLSSYGLDGLHCLLVDYVFEPLPDLQG